MPEPTADGALRELIEAQIAQVYDRSCAANAAQVAMAIVGPKLERLRAELARIRTAVINTYGEDYAGEDVAAEVERLLRHLSEYEADARRILQAKNDALERAQGAIARVRELRNWLATGSTMDIADRITRALDASSAPESPTDAPTDPTRPDDTTQPHNGQENA